MRRTLTIGILALWALLAGCSEPAHKSASWTAPSGAEASVEVYTVTASGADLALREARQAMERIERVMSAGVDDGELGTLNRAAGEGYHVVTDPDLYRCLLLALDYAKASRGAFDPTVGALLPLYRTADGASRFPQDDEIARALERVGWDRVTVAPEARAIRFGHPDMRLDLGGVAAGFGLDAAARVLTRPGSRGALLRQGGSAYAWNHPPQQEDWPVPVGDPRHPDRPLVTVRVANRGVAVSGQTSGPQALLIDPRSGRPVATDVLAAVAVADSAGDAQALSTALVLSGYHRATDLLDRMRQVESVLLVRGETGTRLLASGTLAGRLEISPELETEIDGDVRFQLPPQR